MLLESRDVIFVKYYLAIVNILDLFVKMFFLSDFKKEYF